MDPDLSQKRGRRACPKFLEGSCTKGTDCPFAHIAEGDWACPQCGDHNFAKNTSCRKCKTLKNGGSTRNLIASGRHGCGGHGPSLPQRAPAVVAQEIKKVPCTLFMKGQCKKGKECAYTHIADGDWACPRCSDHNFGRNETCRKCGTSKPRAHSEAIRSADTMSMVNGREACKRFLQGTCTKGKDCLFAHVADGDWLCPECGDHNFARNGTCRKCGGSKSGILGEATESVNALVEVKGKGACKMFLQGNCSKGKDCLFAHIAEGDWPCPHCGDHNFAKKSFCRKCSAPKHDIKRGRMVQKFAPASGMDSAVVKAEVKKKQCALFLKGQCNRGRECAFTHIADGDWVCPSCGDHNFARNETCRKCDMTRPSGPGEVYGTTITVSEVNGRSACKRFLAGTCQKGKDCLFAHIAGGDWLCSECGDHNFARNETCRKCGSSQPSIVSEPVTRSEASGSTSAIAELKGRTSCKRFLQGTCSKGRDCLFAHIAEGDWACLQCGDHNFARNETCRKCGDSKTSFPSAAVGNSSVMSEVKGKSACRMFLQGICSKGKDCRFAHIAEGDWACPECGDHNFARNDTCRKCHTGKHSHVNEAGNHIDDARVMTEVKGKRACKRFLDGTCHKGKDCAFTHIADEDWICPNCDDHNFARNATCRKCSTPKADAVGEDVKRRKI